MRASAVQIYAITLILSAFLLFSVQPMLARMVLPLLGGAPSVWNTAMMFFQGVLLAGYAYAHITTRFLSPRTQAMAHLGLLALAGLALPIGIDALGLPSTTAPTWWQLQAMAVAAGAPFFVLAASAPMIQRWFAASGHKDADNPYFLYAASNIGSLTALVAYPVLVEPMMTLDQQSGGWAIAYAGLFVMVAVCAATMGRHGAAIRPAENQPDHARCITWRVRGMWLALAFIPSSLMLGVTSFITTDLASIPLLWVIPLALYLMTFIIVFARREWVSRDTTFSIFNVVFVLSLFFMLSTLLHATLFIIAVHLALFFAAALLCHKHLADLRPRAADLTEYYMILSLGGVLGGAFNALLAPALFVVPVEYALVLCCVLWVRGAFVSPLRPTARLMALQCGFIILALVMFGFGLDNGARYYYLAAATLAAVGMILLRDQRRAFMVAGGVFLLLNSPLTDLLRYPPIFIERNFFGVVRVADHAPSNTRILYHGTTIHGAQVLDPDHALIPITYYHPSGPAGDVFGILDSRKPGEQKAAVIGLGTGSLACYGRAGRSFDFYEIDPAMVRIAEDPALFTFLSGCKSPYQTFIGDGRLMIEKAPDAYYDVIVVDAFSSDNIPVHLLTEDAVRLYMRKLRADGMIVFNISNRYLNLRPQIAALSAATRVPAISIIDSSGPAYSGAKARYAPSAYAVMTAHPDSLMMLMRRPGWETLPASAEARVWTDGYANLLAALRPVIKTPRKK